MPFGDSDVSKEQKEVSDDLKLIRKRKLTKHFKPTMENILQIVKVSDQFLASFDDAYAKAKNFLEALYRTEQDKGSFGKKYEAKIELYSTILYKNEKTDEWKGKDDIFQMMLDHVGYDMFTMNICYDPAMKDDKNYLNDINVDRSLN